ncbi:hypothetical protein Fmac_032961 [Flemingia macrophylla]|uniref:Uncharacterized protein n=1 Tax=Flemingia macrophylla TaxID=520843 RepID=A0ABD1L7V6_9FABA
MYRCRRSNCDTHYTLRHPLYTWQSTEDVEWGLRTWKVDWSRKVQRTTKSVAGEGAKLSAKSCSPRCASTSSRTRSWACETHVGPHESGRPSYISCERWTRNLGCETSLPRTSSKSISDNAHNIGCYFSAIEVLAKHDEKYMPKEVAATI